MILLQGLMTKVKPFSTEFVLKVNPYQILMFKDLISLKEFYWKNLFFCPMVKNPSFL
jgi:hypothetical protein